MQNVVHNTYAHMQVVEDSVMNWDFYVKSISENLESQQIQFLNFCLHSDQAK